MPVGDRAAILSPDSSSSTSSALAALPPNHLERLVLGLDHLGHEFQEFLPRRAEHPAAGGGRPVVAAAVAAHQLGPAGEVAESLQQVQRRVEGALAEAVAVADELLRDLGAVG